jgi:hypothetical protein
MKQTLATKETKATKGFEGRQLTELAEGASAWLTCELDSMTRCDMENKLALDVLSAMV